MTNRIETLRNYIDKVILNVSDHEERRIAYVHLYGVSYFCTLIALRRGEDAELATMAGMLHDIYTYKCSYSIDHAEKGAVLAREVLTELQITSPAETDLICSAIHNHSDKSGTYSAFDEVLIDADVIQHCLYDFTKPIAEHEKERFGKLVKEFELKI